MRQQAKRGPTLTETEVENDTLPGPTALPQTQPSQARMSTWRQKIFRARTERSIANKKNGVENETASPQQAQEITTTPPVQETGTASAIQTYASSETSVPKPAGAESMPGYGRGIKGILTRKTKP